MCNKMDVEIYIIVTNPEYLEGVVLMRPKLRWRLYRNATFEPNP